MFLSPTEKCYNNKNNSKRKMRHDYPIKCHPDLKTKQVNYFHPFQMCL